MTGKGDVPLRGGRVFCFYCTPTEPPIIAPFHSMVFYPAAPRVNGMHHEMRQTR